MGGTEPTEAERLARVTTVEAGRVAEALDAETILATHGQRRINLIWERTQAIIALSVVEVTLVVVAVLIITPVLRGESSDDAAAIAASTAGIALLANLVGNVTGFYFSRTNHEKVGGVPVAPVPGSGPEPRR